MKKPKEQDQGEDIRNKSDQESYDGDDKIIEQCDEKEE